MPDMEGNIEANNFNAEVASKNTGAFFLKGLGNADWGIKARMASIFNPKSGNTVMLAFDHGYIMGATAGLERTDERLGAHGHIHRPSRKIRRLHNVHARGAQKRDSAGVVRAARPAF